MITLEGISPVALKALADELEYLKGSSYSKQGYTIEFDRAESRVYLKAGECISTWNSVTGEHLGTGS